MKAKEAVETMCSRCNIHEMCQGTGCEPRRILTELADIYDNKQEDETSQKFEQISMMDLLKE